MPDLFASPNPTPVPVLLEVQLDLLTRGKEAYRNGILRAIFQGPCGSGKTWIAAEQTRRSLGKDKVILHIVHRRRLVDQMIKTLLDFGIYAAPIMEGRQTWESPVYCASRDTLLAMLKDGRDLPRADLIIWDECHSAAVDVQKWYLTNCPTSYWTGYTATPVYPNGKSMNPPYQAIVCMKPASELRRIGRLCSVKVYAPEGVKKSRKRGDSVKPCGDPVDHWFKYAEGLPTVVFAATVADSQAICQQYNAKNIKAEHIDASTPEDEREAVFERSRLGQTKIICNCGVLVEGVDLPWLICCQILRGCNSLVLWCQSSGRVMRTFADKECGVILDHSGAVYSFGAPDSDYVWELADGKANEKRNKLPKDRKPICCPKCSLVFVGKPICPECGYAIPQKRRKASTEGLKPKDGVLSAYCPEEQDAFKRNWRKRFTQLVYSCANMGRGMNVVAARFIQETGVKPWEADLQMPLPRGPWRDTLAKEWLQQCKASS